MGDVSTVIALVDATEADATVDDLLAHGLTTGDVDVRDAEPGRYQLADELLQEDAKGAERGALGGAAVGSVVGLLAALLFTEFGIVTMMIVALGAAFGGMVGGLAGLATHDHLGDDPVEFRQVTAGAALRVIEVHHEHWRNRAHRILARHGAEFLSSDRPAAD